VVAAPLVAALVPRALDGLRLDRALASLISGVSRAELARWIEHGRVRVNGVMRAKPSVRLHAGDAIEAEPMPPPPSDATADPSVVFAVVYEDEAIVVVDKPPGLVVHPARGHRDGTLVNGLIARGSLRVEAVGGVDDDEHSDPIAAQRPGIVHRIDRGTSGLLVVAKTGPARAKLQKIFAAHDLDRVYDAVAIGPLPDASTIDTAYGRHPTNRLKFTSILSRVGKRACTHVSVVERLVDGSVARVECRLETGRTHQIRVHLADRGAALLGDPLYGKAATGPHATAIDAIATTLGRQALHARVLGFAHPTTGKPMRFEAPWPSDLREAYDALTALTAATPSPAPRSKTRAR
jgi:23S rRNA pseudouridine1911/1915/1917 synthase